MKIITITSDLGTKDHYVASIKGSIHSIVDKVVVVDVSHDVKPFRVAEAAFHLLNCYKDFPKGTIHLVSVDSVPIIRLQGGMSTFPLILEHEDQYFISNDNGFFGVFLQDRAPQGLWQIDNVMTNVQNFQFPTKKIFVPAAAKILNGESLDSFCTPVNEFNKAFWHAAVLETNLIKGNILHFDSFGNAITNIHKSLFDRYEKNAPFVIFFRREEYKIDIVHNTYSEVPTGERVAIFNENGLLEIAINRGANGSGGGAEKLFGLRLDDIIRIEFQPRGSKETLESLF